MENILSAAQMRDTDAHTCTTFNLSSLQLMEQASQSFVKAFSRTYPERYLKIAVYCGTGNNGGDGLAIARLLYQEGYNHLDVKIARFSDKSSDDFDANLVDIESSHIPVAELKHAAELDVEEAELIIDALIGSGLNKPLEGELRMLVEKINKLDKVVVAVDIPTGFKSEGAMKLSDTVLVADLVISFQRAKVNFFLPESAGFIREIKVVDIGLNEHYIQSLQTPYYLITQKDITSRLKRRAKFTHKGTYGHALIIAGAPKTMGAALLSAEACMCTGAGLTTACVPEEGLTALNTRVPEVMAILNENVNEDLTWKTYQAVGIGPGIGSSPESLALLTKTLKEYNKPVVIDADALNLIGQHHELMQIIPEGSVLTPHVKEFDRLFGEHVSWWDRVVTGIDRAKTMGCTILLKNQYTMIFTRDGKCLFNPTGSPAMASGGMGDVLTGIITSFIAQGYSPEDAVILGAYIHGAAGEEGNDYVVPASSLIKRLPATIATNYST
ncbi:NAD(P)HX epimerase [Arcticibacter svalbardensis MN12-7]|uniref:Bifunctional NAD(P)H-hydrate repair enzyme n=1 Tax=Arcticibacter svalbardensis MN12-7 TaxID=1150600 RepID=R9GLA3_9SPHI|nr:bifunctional ADP-dependent NAD(P)H-hydrate dehydratase/NAD(P)H-hydrate epimerase [Arcticibacter svalbardensis]EOR92612.1 NAD(P)HX epimerase [Arcticibacter svalbardensis MN12-7]